MRTVQPLFHGETETFSLFQDTDCVVPCELTIGIAEDEREKIIIQIQHTNSTTNSVARCYWRAEAPEWLYTLHRALAHQDIWKNGQPHGAFSMTKIEEPYWRMGFSNFLATNHESATCICCLLDEDDMIKLRNIIELFAARIDT